MFEGFDYARVLAMTDRERRWFNNIKKAVYEADKAYMEGRPEDRCFEEMCKAVDTAKTLRRSLLGLEQTKAGNKKLFTEFLDSELPRPEKGGMDLMLFDTRTQRSVQYSFSQLIYAIRCMIHENEKWIDSDLDDIRDGYCLAMVPAEASTTDELLEMGDCLCVRQRGQALHAVLAANVESCRSTLGARLGRDDIQCRPLALEDMFIELVGRDT